jgi:hypothetical protein
MDGWFDQVRDTPGYAAGIMTGKSTATPTTIPGPTSRQLYKPIPYESDYCLHMHPHLRYIKVPITRMMRSLKADSLLSPRTLSMSSAIYLKPASSARLNILIICYSALIAEIKSLIASSYLCTHSKQTRI